MVYIDDFFADFRGMKMCHMIADTDEELDAMADKIGIQRRWKHNGTHYDVCMAKRKLAIKYGAVAVSVLQLARISNEKIKAKRNKKNGKTSGETPS